MLPDKYVRIFEGFFSYIGKREEKVLTVWPLEFFALIERYPESI